MIFSRRVDQRPNERGVQELGVKGLHEDFGLTVDGVWFTNRDFKLLKDEGPGLKCRFAFADPRLLDGAPFLTKVGRNTVRDARFPYIGFAYARTQDAARLETWGSRFPHADLIIGLDHDGVATEDSEYVILKRQ